MSKIKRCRKCRGQAHKVWGSQIGSTQWKCDDCGYSWYTENTHETEGSADG